MKEFNAIEGKAYGISFIKEAKKCYNTSKKSKIIYFWCERKKGR